MHITVDCPGCNRRYQLNEELRGQLMRCPNPSCRHVFQVPTNTDPGDAGPTNGGDNGPAPPDTHPADAGPASGAENSRTPARAGEARTDPAAGGNYASGSVGDLVPMIQAEMVEGSPPEPPSQPAWPSAPAQEVIPLLEATAVEQAEPEPAPTPEAPSWLQPPPVRHPHAPQREALPASEIPAEPSQRRVRKTIHSEPASPAEATVFAPPAPDARPTRKVADTMIAGPSAALELPPSEAQTPSPAKPAIAEEQHDYGSAPVHGRFGVGIVAVLAVVVVALLGVGGWFVFTQLVLTEEQRYEQAKKDYQDAHYGAAEKEFKELVENYPSSDRLAEYQFFTELSGIRNQVESGDPEKNLDLLLEFRGGPYKEKMAKEYPGDAWEMFERVCDGLTRRAQELVESKSPQLAPSREVLAKAKEAAKQAQAFQIPAKRLAGLSEGIAKVEDLLAKTDQLQQLLAILRQALAEPQVKAIDLYDADNLARRKNFTDDPAVKELLEQMKEKLRDGIRWQKAPQNGGRAPPPAEDLAASLPIALPIGGIGANVLKANGVMLAVARGVLYALRERDGRVQWYWRVGIDTTALPVRLPQTDTSPELVLVLSSLTKTLTARVAATGDAVWHHQLSSPCLSQPMVVGSRVYVPTYDGKLEVIELARGELLGWYDLGDHLSVGAAWEDGTNLLYVPGDSRFVYIIDVVQQECVGVLQSDHPNGSLRSPPIVVNWSEGPIAPMVPPGTQQPRYLILTQTDGLGDMKLRAFTLPIQGFSNAPPLQPEVRLRGWSWFPPLSDGSKLVVATDEGVLGLIGIRQPRNNDVTLFPMTSSDIVLKAADGRAGRAQIVYAEGHDLWVLARGELQQFHEALLQEGQRFIPMWSQPPRLGWPLHAGQTSADRETLFTVTRSANAETCLAAAVERENGTVHWQRQLGLICEGESLVLKNEVLVLDRGGALFRFEPGKRPPQSVAVPPPERLLTPPQLLAGKDGQSAYQLLCVAGPNGEPRLILRRYRVGEGMTETRAPQALQAPPVGPAVLGDDCLMLPLADGSPLRQPLNGDRFDPGFNWRARTVDPTSPWFIAHLGGEDFVMTDFPLAEGARGLMRFTWPKGPIAKIQKRSTPLPARIVSQPVVLPPVQGQATPRICFADSHGTVWLMDADMLNADKARRWSLVGSGAGQVKSGKITAGPFLRNGRIGCIVEGRHLFWIDPENAKPIWDKPFAAPQAIVGQPQLVGNVLVVADLSGLLIGLDPATGKPRGPGYQIQAKVAPAAAPVAFGPDQVFVPLTDGTVLLPARKEFETQQ